MTKLIRILLIAIMASIGAICASSKTITHATVTTYNPTEKQCDKTPLITSNGTKIDMKKLKRGEQRYVAVSRDLLWLFPMNSKVIFEIDGQKDIVYEVVDTMNARYNHCFDILQHSSKKNFKMNNVKVTLVSSGNDNKVKEKRK